MELSPFERAPTAHSEAAATTLDAKKLALCSWVREFSPSPLTPCKIIRIELFVFSCITTHQQTNVFSETVFGPVFSV